MISKTERAEQAILKFITEHGGRVRRTQDINPHLEKIGIDLKIAAIALFRLRTKHRVISRVAPGTYVLKKRAAS